MKFWGSLKVDDWWRYPITPSPYGIGVMGRRPGPEVNKERCTSKPMNRPKGNPHPSGRGGGQFLWANPLSIIRSVCGVSSANLSVYDPLPALKGGVSLSGLERYPSLRGLRITFTNHRPQRASKLHVGGIALIACMLWLFCLSFASHTLNIITKNKLETSTYKPSRPS